MIPFMILAALVIAFLLFLISQFWRNYSPKAQPSQPRELIPVDLEAFENLTDPEEEQFLKINLSPAEFREVQRSRIRAAKMYVKALSENAGVLAAVGQSARLQPDPEIVASGHKIFEQAIQLKYWCMLSLLRLDAAMVFPNLISPSTRIANRYLLVTYMAANLPRKAAA